MKIYNVTLTASGITFLALLAMACMDPMTSAAGGGNEQTSRPGSEGPGNTPGLGNPGLPGNAQCAPAAPSDFLVTENLTISGNNLDCDNLEAFDSPFTDLDPGAVAIGDGLVVDQARELTGFSKIRHEVSADVAIVQGDAFSVTIRGESNIVDYYTTTVVDGELVIDWAGPQPSFCAHQKPLITVTLPTFDGLTVFGGGNFQIADIQNNDSVEFVINGGACLDFQGRVGSAMAQINGGADVYMGGEANNLELGLHGGAQIDAQNFRAVDAQVQLTGAGTILVYATGTVDAVCTGAGSIEISGGANVVEQPSAYCTISP